MAASVAFENIRKSFGSFEALKGVTLDIKAGELFFLLGPSGCGKTTLLRTLAGFVEPDSGRVLIGGEDVTRLPPHKRGCAMMFQTYALWPHMSLLQNVSFGLAMRKVPKAEAKRRAMEALDLVHLADRAKDLPGMLSGGQQQRVALARSLVVEPRCLMLDEPLSNLDAKLRLEMRGEIRRVCKERGLTAVYVTHDQKEALSVADRLAVMRSGEVLQVGTPEEVYRKPNGRFVAGFIGEANFLEGEVQADGSVKTAQGIFRAASLPEGASRVALCIRPESVRLGEAPVNAIEGTIRGSVYLGEVAQHEIELAGGVSLKASELNPAFRSQRAAGTKVRLCVAPEDVAALPL